LPPVIFCCHLMEQFIVKLLELLFQ
jgi:hypothetical protein